MNWALARIADFYVVNWFLFVPINTHGLVLKRVVNKALLA
jgi:hypothetical protein